MTEKIEEEKAVLIQGNHHQGANAKIAKVASTRTKRRIKVWKKGKKNQNQNLKAKKKKKNEQ